MSKLSKVKMLCKDDRIFEKLPFDINNVIRNSIGHNDYIDIYGSNILKIRKNNRSDFKEVSLMYVAKTLLDIIKNIVLYEEFIYKVYQNLIGYQDRTIIIKDFDVTK